MAKMEFPSGSTILLVLIVAAVLLYTFSTFMGVGECTQEDVTGADGVSYHSCTTVGQPYPDKGLTFQIPQDVDKQTWNIMKLVVIGVIILFAYAIVTKVGGGAMTKRDAFTIIVLAFVLWFAWDGFISKIFTAPRLDDFTLSVVKKVGLLKP